MKEFSHALPDLLTEDFTTHDIRQLLYELSMELPSLYPHECTSPDEIISSAEELDTEVMAEGLFTHIREDREGFLGKITPHATQPLLYSSKRRLTGMPNKIIKIDEELAPSILSPGTPPSTGVWQRHRILLAAYALLMEEHYDTVVRRGFVEYLRCGVVREAVLRTRERRDVLHMLRRIEKILHEQVLPERPRKAPCNGCKYLEQCHETPNTLASKFF